MRESDGWCLVRLIVGPADANFLASGLAISSTHGVDILHNGRRDIQKSVNDPNLQITAFPHIHILYTLYLTIYRHISSAYITITITSKK